MLWLAVGMLAVPPALMAQEPALAEAVEAQAALPTGHYRLPEKGDVVGEIQVVKAAHEDTLFSIGHRYGVGYEEIRRANPDVSVWIPGEGTEVVIPSRFILPQGPREGIVVNVAEMRLYYYPKPAQGELPIVETYPVSVGRMDWKTPLGQTQITAKAKDPAWYPPASIIKEHAEQGDMLPSVVPPGPDNPLGQFAMRLGIPGYLIHGTNKPLGVGMRVTHGCIRMLPEDIERLFPKVPVGTQVRLINEPFKLGWTPEGALFVQTYPSLEESEDTPVSRITDALDAVTSAVKGKRYPVDYAKLRNEIENPSGVPESLLLVKAPIDIPVVEKKATLYDWLELHEALYSQLETSPTKDDA
ncbi:L,D-transpeptidase family protein [Halomonas sp. McH1-25]|uniref:L,D-transpeptidase family protein n=1 Tax=unclassified Halomonas TaxID=2609666 RepID=UPI001EF41BDF|nr:MULTISPECIES: L,D-transpeptidase family protein [unclassified Halomonas]MCG7599065.1 L,D-transpeptidase family protein [Halomonas sp. McH1-25]MCP1342378.1 L,D-transpeptidase family protein [Halomonas sp. FL8]MCP1360368.1 L,D-transpeptidase family protein [Halomonas sp. BBD45]